VVLEDLSLSLTCWAPPLELAEIDMGSELRELLAGAFPLLLLATSSIFLFLTLANADPRPDPLDESEGFGVVLSSVSSSAALFRFGGGVGRAEAGADAEAEATEGAEVDVETGMAFAPVFLVLVVGGADVDADRDALGDCESGALLVCCRYFEPGRRLVTGEGGTLDDGDSTARFFAGGSDGSGLGRLRGLVEADGAGLDSFFIWISKACFFFGFLVAAVVAVGSLDVVSLSVGTSKCSYRGSDSSILR
jgi:hypothetical protein